MTEAKVAGRSGRDTATWMRGMPSVFGFDPEIPLDRIYVRGIDVHGCRLAEGTESSDHTPLLLHFSVQD